MNENILISVVIPTFNRRNSLCRCIESVANNDLNNCEVIVVDDGSKDGTDTMFTEKYSWVKYIYQENKGVSSARNKGMEVARGEYIAFLDSDDIWNPERLTILKKIIKVLPDQVDILFNDMDFLISKKGSGQSCSDRYFGVPKKPLISAMKNSIKLSIKQEPLVIPFDNVYKNLIAGNILQPSCVLLRRQTFITDGGFRENFRVAEDSDFFLRLSQQHIIAYIPLILTSIEEPKMLNSLSNPKNNIKKISNMLTAMQEHIEIASDQSILKRLINRKAELHAFRAYHYLSELDLQKAKHDSKEAIKINFHFKYLSIWILASMPQKLMRLIGELKRSLKKI